MTLPGLDAYISKSKARADVASSSNFAPTFANPYFPNEDLPSDFDGSREDRNFQLLAIED
jgi:hypothetical protein